MAEKIQLSIIIPCYNEEKRLTKKFAFQIDFLREHIKPFEVILINDGSTDKTEQIINNLSTKYPQVKAISYSKNRGKGYAVKLGVESAKGKIIGFTDADFAISLKDLPRVLTLLETDFDIVIGNRKTKVSKLSNSPDRIRRIFSFLHSNINNFLLDLGPIKDTLCGFKFFKRDVAKNLFKDLNIYRWFFDLAILIAAKKLNKKIIQIPVEWQEIRGGQVKLLNAIKTSLKEHLLIYSEFFNLKIYTALISLLTIVVLSPFLINPKSLTQRNGDWADLVWPNYFFIKETIFKYQQIPLWNPYIFSGIPEIANPQSPLIYPLNILILLLPLDYGLIFLIFIHVIFAGIFLYKLSIQKLLWSKKAALILSFGIIYSPFFWSKFSIGHLSMGFAMLLAAPIIYYGFDLIKKLKIKELFLLSIYLSLQYLNYPTIWFYTVLFGGLALVIYLIFKNKLKILSKFFLAILINIFLLLPVLFVQFIAGGQITRTLLSQEDLSIPIWSIKRFIQAAFLPSNFYNGIETEVWLYPGVGLILIAIFGFLKLNKIFKIIALISCLLIVLITLGSRTPFFGFLIQSIPGFSLLRVSTRDWFVMIFVLSILGAYFFEKVKFSYNKSILVLIIIELLLFSTFRLWLVPLEYTFIENQKKPVELLIDDTNYRYYCTNRCFSTAKTIPNDILSADGYHILILRNYRQKLSEAGGFLPPKYTGNIPTYFDSNAQPDAEKLGKFSVKYLVSDHDIKDKNFIYQKSQDNYSLYLNSKSLPRFRFKNWDNKILVLKNTPNQIILITEGAKDFLVIADPYYPGWNAYINGQKTVIELEDMWARKIEVPEGKNTIEILFQPFSI